MWDDDGIDPHDVAKALEKSGWTFVDDARRFSCGICGTDTTTTFGMRNAWIDSAAQIGKPQSREIRICPDCKIATTFVDRGQFPKPVKSSRFNVSDKPDPIRQIVALYHESCYSIGANAPSCAVLMFRKLLMHVAVEQGAEEELRFVQYCEYLKNSNVVGKPQHPILDRIKDAGNIENHEITRATDEQAQDLLELTSVLIKTIYFMD